MLASAPCPSESASSELSGRSNEGRSLVEAHPFAIYKDRQEPSIGLDQLFAQIGRKFGQQSNPERALRFSWMDGIRIHIMIKMYFLN